MRYSVPWRCLCFAGRSGSDPEHTSQHTETQASTCKHGDALGGALNTLIQGLWVRPPAKPLEERGMSPIHSQVEKTRVRRILHCEVWQAANTALHASVPT